MGGGGSCLAIKPDYLAMNLTSLLLSVTPSNVLDSCVLVSLPIK